MLTATFVKASSRTTVKCDPGLAQTHRYGSPLLKEVILLLGGGVGLELLHHHPGCNPGPCTPHQAGPSRGAEKDIKTRSQSKPVSFIKPASPPGLSISQESRASCKQGPRRGKAQGHRGQVAGRMFFAIPGAPGATAQRGGRQARGLHPEEGAAGSGAPSPGLSESGHVDSARLRPGKGIKCTGATPASLSARLGRSWKARVEISSGSYNVRKAWNGFTRALAEDLIESILRWRNKTIRNGV